MSDERLKYVDVARGIGIILVVIGHTITKDMAQTSLALNILRLFIYTVHMPLFFTIAGYLFEKNKTIYLNDTIGKYVEKKGKMFMVPYVAFSIITYVIITIAMLIPQIASVLQNQGYYSVSFGEMCFSILTYINHQDSHLWFCYVMLLVLLINRICLLKKNNWYITLILFVIYICSYLWSQSIPEVIWKTMHYLLIFQIGRMMWSSALRDSKSIVRVMWISCLVAFVALVFCRQYDMEALRPIFTLVVEITGSWIILDVISKSCMKTRIGEKIGTLGSGNVSYVIYLLHMPFMTSFMVYVLEKMNVPVIITILLVTIATLLICFLLYKYVLSKIQICKLLLGEKKGDNHKNEIV